MKEEPFEYDFIESVDTSKSQPEPSQNLNAPGNIASIPIEAFDTKSWFASCENQADAAQQPLNHAGISDIPSTSLNENLRKSKSPASYSKLPRCLLPPEKLEKLRERERKTTAAWRKRKAEQLSPEERSLSRVSRSELPPEEVQKLRERGRKASALYRQRIAEERKNAEDATSLRIPPSLLTLRDLEIAREKMEKEKKAEEMKEKDEKAEEMKETEDKSQEMKEKGANSKEVLENEPNNEELKEKESETEAATVPLSQLVPPPKRRTYLLPRKVLPPEEIQKIRERSKRLAKAWRERKEKERKEAEEQEKANENEAETCSGTQPAQDESQKNPDEPQSSRAGSEVSRDSSEPESKGKKNLKRGEMPPDKLMDARRRSRECMAKYRKRKAEKQKKLQAELYGPLPEEPKNSISIMQCPRKYLTPEELQQVRERHKMIRAAKKEQKKLEEGAKVLTQEELDKMHEEKEKAWAEWWKEKAAKRAQLGHNSVSRIPRSLLTPDELEHEREKERKRKAQERAQKKAEQQGLSDTVGRNTPFASEDASDAERSCSRSCSIVSQKSSVPNSEKSGSEARHSNATIVSTVACSSVSRESSVQYLEQNCLEAPNFADISQVESSKVVKSEELAQSGLDAFVQWTIQEAALSDSSPAKPIRPGRIPRSQMSPEELRYVRERERKSQAALRRRKAEELKKMRELEGTPATEVRRRGSNRKPRCELTPEELLRVRERERIATARRRQKKAEENRSLGLGGSTSQPRRLKRSEMSPETLRRVRERDRLAARRRRTGVDINAAGSMSPTSLMQSRSLIHGEGISVEELLATTNVIGSTTPPVKIKSEEPSGLDDYLNLSEESVFMETQEAGASLPPIIPNSFEEPTLSSLFSRPNIPIDDFNASTDVKAAFSGFTLDAGTSSADNGVDARNLMVFSGNSDSKDVVQLIYDSNSTGTNIET